MCSPLKIPQNPSEDDIRVLFSHVVLSTCKNINEQPVRYLERLTGRTTGWDVVGRWEVGSTQAYLQFGDLPT